MAKRLVILGAPGVGKGTQAKIIEADYGWQHVSTGDMLREAMKNETSLGEKVKQFVETGDLVPDNLIVEMVGEYLGQKDQKEGFILDGFPRTVLQAEQLDGLLVNLNLALDGVISIDVPDEEIINRLSKRYLCETCGPVIINTKNGDHQPLCPNCKGKINRRKDDEPETVRHRLKIYNERTRSLINYYEGRKLLMHVDGIGTVDEIYKRVVSALENTSVSL